MENYVAYLVEWVSTYPLVLVPLWILCIAQAWLIVRAFGYRWRTALAIGGAFVLLISWIGLTSLYFTSTACV